MIWKLLNKIGCTPSIEAVIVSEPEKVSGGYSYNIKCINKTYRLFGIKLFKVKM